VSLLFKKKVKHIDTIHLIGYNSCSFVEGDGLREVIYIAQCTHACLGCHNKQYWNDVGDTYEIDDVVERLTKNPRTNITISGGDGLTIQYEGTLKLLRKLKEKSNKNIWLYTGYTWEELFKLNKDEVLNYIDVLVDGRFEIDKRDIALNFKGSSNQKIILVQQSLKQDKIILWQPEN
jgi:anaerobic ribonucleoside-triphosphate reductase activating protein